MIFIFCHSISLAIHFPISKDGLALYKKISKKKPKNLKPGKVRCNYADGKDLKDCADCEYRHPGPLRSAKSVSKPWSAPKAPRKAKVAKTMESSDLASETTAAMGNLGQQDPWI